MFTDFPPHDQNSGQITVTDIKVLINDQVNSAAVHVLGLHTEMQDMMGLVSNRL